MGEPVFISQYRTGQVTLVAGHATRFRPIWTAGTKGSRIHAILASANDNADNTIKIGIGRIVTSGANMGQGAYGSTTTITRTSGSGSFVTDGWLVGDKVLPIGATTLANDADNILTTVAATTLTASAASWSAENLPTTSNLYRLVKMWTVPAPINSGLDQVIPAIDVIDIDNVPALAMNGDIFITLGPSDVLFAGAGTTLGSGENIDITVFGGDY